MKMCVCCIRVVCVFGRALVALRFSSIGVRLLGEVVSRVCSPELGPVGRIQRNEIRTRTRHSLPSQHLFVPSRWRWATQPRGALPRRGASYTPNAQYPAEHAAARALRHCILLAGRISLRRGLLLSLTRLHQQLLCGGLQCVAPRVRGSDGNERGDSEDEKDDGCSRRRFRRRCRWRRPRQWWWR